VGPSLPIQKTRSSKLAASLKFKLEPKLDQQVAANLQLQIGSKRCLRKRRKTRIKKPAVNWQQSVQQ